MQGFFHYMVKTSYFQISRNLEVVRYVFVIIRSLWIWKDASTALLPRCLSNFEAMLSVYHPIQWLRDLTRFGCKTSSTQCGNSPGRRATPYPSMHPSARAASRLAPSQWETSLQSNAVSHWLSANLESALWQMARGGRRQTGWRKHQKFTE